MLRILFRLLCALLVGIFISLWIVQNNPVVEQLITKKLVTLLEKEWNIKIDVHSCRINFFTCSVFLKKGHVRYLKKKNCHWTFGQCKIHISPWQFIFDKKVALFITINNIKVNTGIEDGEVDVIPHIKKILETKAREIKVVPELVQLNNIDVTLTHNDHTAHVLIDGSITFTEKKHGIIAVNTGSLVVDNRSVLENIKGVCKLEKLNDRWRTTLDYSCNPIFHLGQVYTIKGLMDDKKRELSLINSEKTFTCDASYDSNAHYVRLSGVLPVNFLNHFYAFIKNTGCVQGNFEGACSFDFKTHLGQDFATTGELTIDGARYKNIALQKIVCSDIILNARELKTKYAITYSPEIALAGEGNWVFGDHAGKFSITNPETIKLTKNTDTPVNKSWVIQKNDLCATVNIKPGEDPHAGYKLALTNTKTEKSYSYQGQGSFCNNIIRTHGITRKGSYVLGVSLNPTPHVIQLNYTSKNNRLISLVTKNPEDTLLTGTFHCGLIRTWLDQSARRLILGNNSLFSLRINQKDLSQITGSVELIDGKFYIPEMQNLIEKAKADIIFSYPENKLVLDDVTIGFGRGSLYCPRATILLTDKYTLHMLHVPIQITNLLINWKRDFYAFIYGNILLNKLPEKSLKLFGNIILKKSLLKDNIFSHGASSSFSEPLGIGLPYNLECDVHIISEKPIKAKTSTLEASSSIDLKVQYTRGKDIISTPHITGSINLEHGCINFLRNKLLIEYGKIQFLPHQFNDPIIDLIARNKINKYIVTLQATGSLQKPTIILESTPELTEEQILGLLLTGSENAKLQTDLFAMLEQNLHNIVLGGKNSLPKAATFFQKLAKPLQYVQIAPDFTDQSGRGGIKGTVSVNLNEQVHAQIQKNFNLQEDFSVQVEYLLSDDINIRGIKDQRGEMGAEVELRVKL